MAALRGRSGTVSIAALRGLEILQNEGPGNEIFQGLGLMLEVLGRRGSVARKKAAGAFAPSEGGGVLARPETVRFVRSGGACVDSVLFLLTHEHAHVQH